MSARDLCTDCAHARFSIPADQMVAKSGPAYEQWVRSMIDYAGRLAASI